LRLPHLTDKQAEIVRNRAKKSGIDPDTCPTCLSKADQYGERENGTYRYEGEERECDCATQIMLRKHYLLANIPDQYMRLSWTWDFTGDMKAKEAVELYLEKWPAFKLNGMGVEFAGTLGIGKTFAATTIGRELVKRREDVYFLPFNQMLYAMRYEDKEILSRLDEVNVLILDEIQPPPDPKLIAVFSNQFEVIVRNRTNYNGVTIMTTNMDESEVEQHYPRVYSLLRAKQIRVEIDGSDARKGVTGKKNLELILNNETRPIT
jgi:DNA replication protein DnaC